MTNVNKTANLFNTKWMAATPVEFNVKWKNSTGYLDQGVKHELAAGEQERCVDDMGRRVLLTGTPLGTVVVFQRYTNDDSVYVLNQPSALRAFTTTDSRMSEDEMWSYVGGEFGAMNIGKRLLQLQKAFETAVISKELAEEI